jgi:hypothetical protein
LSPRLFLLRCIEPGLTLLPGYMVSDAARVMLLSIAGQESNWEKRAQVNGPAKGYWQFEPAGVEAVLKQTATIAYGLLETSNVPVTDAFAAIQYNDPLACAFARLLLWFDSSPLPAIGSASEAFEYYVGCWKPGKPDKTRWGPAYSTACSTVASK